MPGGGGRFTLPQEFHAQEDISGAEILLSVNLLREFPGYIYGYIYSAATRSVIQVMMSAVASSRMVSLSSSCRAPG